VVAHELRTPLTRRLRGSPSSSLSRRAARARGAVLEPPPWRSGAAGRIVAGAARSLRIESGRPLSSGREPVGTWPSSSSGNVELFAASTGRHRFEWNARPVADAATARSGRVDQTHPQEPELQRGEVPPRRRASLPRVRRTSGRAWWCSRRGRWSRNTGQPPVRAIFDKYVRVPNRETAASGSGWGSALVRALAEATEEGSKSRACRARGSTFSPCFCGRKPGFCQFSRLVRLDTRFPARVPSCCDGAARNSLGGRSRSRWSKRLVAPKVAE